MITIFSIPKPFTGQMSTIQCNALSSWVNLDKDIEVILLGDEPGIEEAANLYKVTLVKEIEKNSYGTPLLNSAFRIAVGKAKFDTLCYVNADILLTPLFLQVLRNIRINPFLGVVRRMNISVTTGFDFSVPGKYSEIEMYAKKMGKGGEYWEIDCFVLSKNDRLVDLPPFAVGRPIWDLWYIYHALSQKIPVIDLSDAVMVYHQNHDYGHVKNRTGHRWEGPEADANRSLVKINLQPLSIANATHVIRKGKVVRALDLFHLRVFIGSIPAFYPQLTGPIGFARQVKNFLRSVFKKG